MDEKISQYVNLYNEILEKVGIPDIAIRIVEQYATDIRGTKIEEGKDKRTQLMNNSKKQPTQKQIDFLKNHNKYKEGMDKEEATNIISEIIKSLNK